MLPAAHCQPQNDEAGGAFMRASDKSRCLHERFSCLEPRRLSRKEFAEAGHSAVSTPGTISSSKLTLPSGVCFQPIANGRGLRVLWFQLQQTQIMGTRLGRLAELPRIEIGQREVRPRFPGIGG